MEIDLFRAIRILWARRYFISLVSILAALLGFGSTLLMTPGYTAKTEFLMQAVGNKQGGAAGALGLTSLVGQFGLDMSGNQKIFEIFPRVLESRSFLSELKDLKVLTEKDSGKTLAQFLVPKPNPKIPLDFQLLEKIRKMMDLGKEKDGVNVLIVKGPDPVFTAFLANTLVSRLEKYYSTLETKKALQNLNFLEEKQRGSQKELGVIADSIRIFKEHNREINIPLLFQRLYWLQMDQKIREEKYLLLTREFESAKIDYEKVKPIVVVVDSAIVPFAKSEPKKKVAVVVSCLLGFILSTVWIIGTEWLKQTRTT